MNVALARVLYTHALVAAPRLALGRFGSLAGFLGDPRLGMAGAFLSLRRVIPDYYPLTRDVEWYISDEQRLGRLLDYAVIAPRLRRLYEWSADELGELRLLGLVRDGSPIYAWPYEQRHVWRTQHLPFPAAYSNASRELAEERGAQSRAVPVGAPQPVSPGMSWIFGTKGLADRGGATPSNRRSGSVDRSIWARRLQKSARLFPTIAGNSLVTGVRVRTNVG